MWLGTRFLASEEIAVEPSYQERLLWAAEADNLLSTLFDIGRPDARCRTLRDSTEMRWEAAGRLPSGQRPGEGEVLANWADGRLVVRYTTSVPYAGIPGDIRAMELPAGQGVGLATRGQPAAEIVRELADEAGVETLRSSSRS